MSSRHRRFRREQRPAEPMSQPVTPLQTATDAALPGNSGQGERRSRTRPDTSTILRSLIDEVITRSDTIEPGLHTGSGDVALPSSTELPGNNPGAMPAPAIAEPPPLLPDNPMLPLTARADYTDPITASNRALGDDDAGAEAAIRGSVLLVILVGVTVVSAIITYLTLRP